MNSHGWTPFLYAFLSVITFNGASVIYAQYSSRFSSAWMNIVKASVGLVGFVVTVAIMLVLGRENPNLFRQPSALYFVASGAIGLGLADLFILKAFVHLGSARTMVIFSFAPLFMGTQAYFFFGQTITVRQLSAIFLFIACVGILTYERSRKVGRWEFSGVALALAGLILDNIGVMLTRQGFDSTGLTPMSANAIRTAGALATLLIVGKWRGVRAYQDWMALPMSPKLTLVAVSFAGTYLSLFFWLSAVQVGHLASIAAVSGLSPIVGSLWEWLILKKRPTPALLGCLILVIPGMYLLLS